MDKELLKQALAYVRWQSVGECKTAGWYTAPPTAFELDAALVAAIAQPEQRHDKTIDSILEGIDSDECSSYEGWWETSTDAKFGASKLAEVKAYFAACIAQPEQPTAQPVFWANLDFALQDPIFNRCRAIMGTTNEFQDGALLNVLRYFLTTALPVQPAKIEPAQPESKA